MKYGITQNITADLTINTDFAQVEVDEQQVNLTRFNLFFPEKRDFFLEGLGTFAFAGRASAGLGAGTGDTPYLFFSRRIGLDQSRVIPIVAGGRTTGKAGKFTFGAINVQTDDDDGGEDRVGELHGAARQARHPAPQQHRRHVHASHGHARAGRRERGLRRRCGDVVLPERPLRRLPRGDRRPRDATATTSVIAASSTTTPTSTACRLERLVVEPNFLPEIGFVRRTDMRRNFGQLRYSPRPTERAERAPADDAGEPQLPDQQPRIASTRARRSARGEAEFTNSDLFSVTYTDSFERLVRPFAIATGVTLPVGSLRLSHHAHRLHRRPAAAAIRARWSTSSGTFYNGDRQTIALNMARLQVTPQVSLEPSFSINWVDLVQGSFTAKVARTRATYTITPRMFVSGIVQYNSAGTSFGSNVRFRWEYRPGSELFVVYTDDFNTEELRPDVDVPPQPRLRDQIQSAVPS